MSSSKKYRQYAEEVAFHFEQVGLSRTAGRIFGWLLICAEPQQTMNDLMDGLQVSKSSVSTATRFLMQIGLIQRFSLPGERRDYYCLAKNVWQETMRQQEKPIVEFRKLADQGLELLADQPVERQNRLRKMRDFYAFIEKEFPILLDRWEAKQDSVSEGIIDE